MSANICSSWRPSWRGQRFPYCACALQYQYQCELVAIYICEHGGCKGKESPKMILWRGLFNGGFIQKEDKNKKNLSRRKNRKTNENSLRWNLWNLWDLFFYIYSFSLYRRAFPQVAVAWLLNSPKTLLTLVSPLFYGSAGNPQRKHQLEQPFNLSKSVANLTNYLPK